MNNSSPYKIGDKVVFIDKKASTSEKTCMRLGEVVGGQVYRVSDQSEPQWEYVIKAVNDAIFTVNQSDLA